MDVENDFEVVVDKWDSYDFVLKAPIRPTDIAFLEEGIKNQLLSICMYGLKYSVSLHTFEYKVIMVFSTLRAWFRFHCLEVLVMNNW